MDSKVEEKLLSFVPVLVNGNTERKIAQQFSVDGYPNVQFVTADGKSHGSISGYVATDEFLSKTSSALAAIGDIKLSSAYVKYLNSMAKKDYKEKKYRDSLLRVTELKQFGIDEKKMKKALNVREKIETFANKQLEKARKVHAENPRKAKKALEAIAKEFMGLPAAEEARKLLG